MPSLLHIRLNTLLLLLLVAMAAALIAMVATRAYGGPLDPPGAPASTDGVREPGTPITSIPYTITTPGYYYFTGNLTATISGQNGVSISSEGVTLDLKGFVLRGFPAASQTGTGIGSGVVKNIVVRDGIVDGWGLGINFGQSVSAGVSGVRMSNNATAMSASNTTLEDCIVFSNTAGVAVVRSVVRRCRFDVNIGNALNPVDDNSIEGNYFSNNSAPGTYDIAVTGNDNVIRDNESHDNNGAFLGIFPGALRTLVVRSRYGCAHGIVNNGSVTVAPAAGAVDGNYCF